MGMVAWLVRIFVFLLLTGCGSDNELDLARIQRIDVAGAGTAEVFDADVHHYSFEWLNYRSPPVVTVIGSGGDVVEINGVLVDVNTPYRPSLTAGEQIAIRVKGLDEDGSSVTYEYAAQADSFPRYNVSGQLSGAGELLLTPRSTSGNYLLAIDHLGQPIFYKKIQSRVADFKRTESSGKVRYSYIEGVAILQGVGYFEGEVVLLDSDFIEFERIQGLVPNPENGREEVVSSENHDFIYLDDGHYILSAYVPKVVTNIPGTGGAEVPVVASVIQEQWNGEIVFEWDSTNYPELYDESEEQNDYLTVVPNRPWKDYLHFNSMEIDENDGELIVSFRSLNAVKKISRHNGSIIWTLGGRADDFNLTPHQMMQGQHTARMDGLSNLYVFDNNTYMGGVGPTIQRFFNYAQERSRTFTSTRIVKYRIDEFSKRIHGFSEIYVPANGALPFHFTAFTGSVQPLVGGNILIGWGGHLPEQTDVSELNPNSNEIVFELQFLADEGDPSTRYSSYRAQFARH